MNRYYLSFIEIKAELNIFQACIFDFFLFDFNKNNDGTDLDLGTLISFNKGDELFNSWTIQDFLIWFLD